MKKGEVETMPIVSKFYGIVIRMFRLRSFGARFHAIYDNCELVVNLWPLQIISGDAPRRVKDMVLEWGTQHQEELLLAWHRVQSGEAPNTIAPLQ